MAAGVGVHRPDVHLVAVSLGRHAAVVPDRDRKEVEHQVRVVDVVVAPHEAAALEVVGGPETAAVEQPLVADLRSGAELEARRDRDRLLRRVLDVDLEVVLEVLPHARHVGDDADAEGAQVVGVADSGELQELGRVDGPTAEDDLARGDRPVQASGPEVVDAGGSLAVETHAGDERKGLDPEVLPVHHRVEVRAGRGEAAPTTDVAVEPREPLLAVAVDVVGQWVAGVLRGLEERPEERVLGGPALEHQRAVTTAPVVGAGDAGLHPLEVRQAVQVVPGLHARLRAPALVVERVPALEDHPVDAAGAAEHLAACVVDAAAVHLRLRVGLVLPVVEPVPDRDGQRGRHLDEGVDPEVGPAGLEHENAGPGVGAEPVREGTAGGAATDDHDVVRVAPPARRPHCSEPPNHCWTLGSMLCQMCLVSRYSSSPARPSSRPIPDCLYPPHSACGTYGW